MCDRPSSRVTKPRKHRLFNPGIAFVKDNQVAGGLAYLRWRLNRRPSVTTHFQHPIRLTISANARSGGPDPNTIGGCRNEPNITRIEQQVPKSRRPVNHKV
ncbi:hypothetical protein X801_09861, partial [Opisthorchis viverrini]